VREQDIACLENQADVEDENDEDEGDKGEKVLCPADLYFLWSLRIFGNVAKMMMNQRCFAQK
jgi:hypothetical protein